MTGNAGAACVAVTAVLLALFAGPASAATLTPTRTDDPAPDGCLPGDCSLREAVETADTNGEPDTIPLGSGTYDVTLGQLRFDNTDGAVEVLGAGARSTIVASDGGSRVWNLFNGDGVTLSGMTITGGGGTTQGGGVFNGRPATLENVAIVDNQSDSQGGPFGGQGGGVFHNFGLLTIRNSLIAGNRALGTGGAGQGGGVFANDTVTLENVTVSGNATDTDSGVPGQGGGIFANDAMQLTNITLTANQADAGGFGQGGGIFINDDDVKLKNSILSGNLVGAGASDCFLNDPVVSQGHNTAGGTDCGLTGTGDQESTDPQLGVLQDNGGQTDTRAIADTSPAKDSADAAACPATDQRGVPRPQFAGCDRGAFEIEAPTPPPPEEPPAQPGPQPGPQPEPRQVRCAGAQASIVGVPDDRGVLRVPGQIALPGGSRQGGNEVDGTIIVGTAGADELIGTPGRDLIVAGSSDDVIRGKGDEDLICAGPGEDNAKGGSGDDLLRGGGSDDTVRGGAGDDNVKGSNGADAAAGGPGDDRVIGNKGDDRLRGNKGKDVLKGRVGDDGLLGGAGPDTLGGGKGGDVLDGGGGRNKCNGGPGSNKLRNCGR